MALLGRGTTRPDVGGSTACHAAAVSKVYGERETAVHALRDVTLDIPRSAFTAIMGPSGSGKSTLLHCLAALDTPSSGRVYLGGTELTALSRRKQAQVRRDRIGFVFQSFNLVPTLDALENITLPQLLAGRRPDRAWLEHVITRIGLGDRLHHRPSELSGGQQQRIALARALAGRPEVIFADEPTGNLDTTASREMLTLLRDAVDLFDQTVVTVTHDPSIARYADQILFFSDGTVIDRTDAPDVDRVLERLRQDDGVDHGGGDRERGLQVTRRSDGQQTMRSRRRRQPDEPTPGRPMVGSDDEVEVARQERWLRRIREQFEAEQLDDAAPGDDPSATRPYVDPFTYDTGQGALPAQALSYTHDTGRPDPGGNGARMPVDRTADQHHTDGYGNRYRDTVDDRHGPAQPDAAYAAPPDEGWLPPVRSWLEPPDDDDGTDRWRAETVTQPELAPWSRPELEPGNEPERMQQMDTPDPADGGGDPWAPADRHLAEEYRSERGNPRRPRTWQDEHDGGQEWSTGRRRAVDDDHVDDVGSQRRDSDTGDPVGRRQDDPAPYGSDDFDYRPRWSITGADVGPDDDVVTPTWQPDDTHDDRAEPSQQPAADADRAEPRHHDTHDDRAEPWQPAADAGRNGTRSNGHRPNDVAPGTPDGDPWSEVWDANGGPDVSEVWTPTFDHSWPTNGNGHAVWATPAEPDTDHRGTPPPPHDRADHVQAPPPGGDDPDPAGHARGGAQDQRQRREPVDGRPAGGSPTDDRHVTAHPPVDAHQPSAPPPAADQPTADTHTTAGEHRVVEEQHAVGGAPPPADDHTAIPRVDDPPATGPTRFADDADIPAARPPDDPPAPVHTGTRADADPRTDRTDPPTRGRNVPPDDTRTPDHVEAHPEPRTTAPAPHHEDPPARHDPPPPPADDPTVPPPLASLRNTRRPDHPGDPMEALQSLQEQLDRLGGAGRRQSRPTGSGRDTGRRERP